MNEGIVKIVIVISYIMLLTGIVLLWFFEFWKLYMNIKMRNRLRTRKNQGKSRGRLYEHVSMLLKVTLGKNVKIVGFIIFNLIIFVSVFIGGLRNYSLGYAVFLGGCASTLSVLILEIRLGNIRRKGSYEGEFFVSKMLTKYRISGENIYEAIEMALQDNANTKMCSKILYEILLDVRNTSNKEDMKKIFNKFYFGINTNWSKMMAYNFYLSATRGIDITGAMEDILFQLREVRMLGEERKRANGEATRIVVFLIPILYLSTILISINFVGISVSEFIKNQFLTKGGFLLFVISIFMFLLNIILTQIVNNKKFDY